MSIPTRNCVRRLAICCGSKNTPKMTMLMKSLISPTSRPKQKDRMTRRILLFYLARKTRSLSGSASSSQSLLSTGRRARSLTTSTTSGSTKWLSGSLHSPLRRSASNTRGKRRHFRSSLWKRKQGRKKPADCWKSYILNSTESLWRTAPLRSFLSASKSTSFKCCLALLC